MVIKLEQRIWIGDSIGWVRGGRSGDNDYECFHSRGGLIFDFFVVGSLHMKTSSEGRMRK